MKIRIEGASEHNLQDIDVEFGDGLTAVTGVSGSGKTSLVFDTLYHEAYRRFMEIFSTGPSHLRLTPAKARSITGLGPSVAVGQNLLNRNPGSTIATASGLHPLFRLLYARFGQRHCSVCGTGLSVLTEDELIEYIAGIAVKEDVTLYAPLIKGVPGSHRTLLELLASEFGSEKILVDKVLGYHDFLDPALPHEVAIQLGHFARQEHQIQDIRQVIKTAAALGSTAITVQCLSGNQTLARAPVCTECGAWFGALEPVHFHTPCPHCNGNGCGQCANTGLLPQAASVTWHELRLPELLANSVSEIHSLFINHPLPSTANRLQIEIVRRLDALEQTGLGYLSLDRPAPTLSRGEAQRVRLAVALTSQLEDMLHVLDEPTIGQHPADVTRLLPAFRKLGGPVIFVEHDRSAVAVADRAIDLGPGAGLQGGRLLFNGTPAELWGADCPSGNYFSLRQRVLIPEQRPEPVKFITIRGAYLRNLRNIDVPIPFSRLTVITGVSGSGKSTFVDDVLHASLVNGRPIGCRAIDGPGIKPVLVDQEPIGRNPRSTPATYTNLADLIRDLYASATGLTPSHFSFNRDAGACEECQGMGAIEVHMRYLPSSWIPCPVCGGQRFSEEVLAAQVDFEDQKLSIADFYELPVSEARKMMMADNRLPVKSQQSAGRILDALQDVGLGYLTLGQPSPTLSGGEAQRVKLAKFLGKQSLAKQLLILDEPSTGLHPQDINGLLIVLDRLVRAGATVLVVEHNTDMIRAADWVIDLGPGAGPDGGDLLYAGPLPGLFQVGTSLTGKALKEEQNLKPRPLQADNISAGSNSISIRGARAHNLKNIDIDFPKGKISVVTGVSGSGKSSLVGDVLEVEARRRYLESLSMYERQGTHEGPDAPVDAVRGLGVTLTISPERYLTARRATVGTATELTYHLAVLFSALGERKCLECETQMIKGKEWYCPNCHATASIAQPRHFLSTHYSAACQTCHGVTTLQVPNPDKLIIHPEKPLIRGAMYSPGFFPDGYLGKPYNGGYDELQAMAVRYGFDPATTPWNEMSPEAQQAFLYGEAETMPVTFHSRSGRVQIRYVKFPGFYGFVRDWDVGGTYTDTRECPDCHGSGLKPEYAAVQLAGHGIDALGKMPLRQLGEILNNLSIPENKSHTEDVIASLQTARKRNHFMVQVGLGYLHMKRLSGSLSAGEAQRVRLAGLLGAGLTSLTVLLDEPSRGLHPVEVEALLEALRQLRDEGNTVILVEHDPVFIHSADYLVDMGPGAGAYGGKIVAKGQLEEVFQANTLTAAWLSGQKQMDFRRPTREPDRWMQIHGARANNLRGDTISIPLNVFVGICGVSGSGKSTLILDTLGRALAPKKQTTSVAHEPIDPGEHDAITGAPQRVMIVDQVRAGISSPANYLGLNGLLQALFAECEEAQALGLDEKSLGHTCSACGGQGTNRTDMGFLPDIYTPCETCRGTGYSPEAWSVHLRGVSLPEVDRLTIDQVNQLFGDDKSLSRSLQAAQQVGLGYLVLRQPGYSLSGGEAQRLKIAKELSSFYQDKTKKAKAQTLYILDEPTVGQHLEDVARLAGVLHHLVDAGQSVIVVEHHPHLLATCDWLIELGPGGGPEGGRVIASGKPGTLAQGNTPIAPYLREILRGEK